MKHLLNRAPLQLYKFSRWLIMADFNVFFVWNAMAPSGNLSTFWDAISSFYWIEKGSAKDD